MWKEINLAVLEEFDRYGDGLWTQAGRVPALAEGFGALAQKVWTVPGKPSFSHAAIHLNRLPDPWR